MRKIYVLLSSILLLASCGQSNKEYTVNFETNGGSIIQNYRGSVIEESPKTEKDGYSFVAWFNNANFESNPIAFPYTLTKDETFYAKWSKLQYTVKFESNGGSLVNDFTGEIIDTQPVTTKQFNTFTGWFLEESCSGEPVSFPYVINSNITLYAGWEKQKIIPEGLKIMSCTNFGKTADMYFSASYETSSIVFNFNIVDEVVFTGLTGSDIGYNDNIEIIAQRTTNYSAGWVPTETIKILVDPEYNEITSPTRCFFERAVWEGGWSGIDTKKPDNVKITAQKRLQSVDGYTGYSISIGIPYNEFGLLSKGDAIGKISFCPSLRNSESSTRTSFAGCSYLGTQYKNSWTHLILDSSGEIKTGYMPENMAFGDSYTDVAFWKTLPTDFKDQLVSAGIGGTQTTDWLKGANFELLTSRNVKNYLIHLGVNDIDNNTGVKEVVYNLKTLFESIHSINNDANIYWTTICNNINFSNIRYGNYDAELTFLKDAYQYVNEAIKEYANNVAYLNVIDLADNLLDENTGLAKKDFMQDGLHLNELGYNLWAKLIKNSLHLNDLTNNDLIGDVGDYATSRGVDLTNISNGSYENIEKYNSFIFFKDSNANSFTASLSVNVKKIYNFDQFPKIGFFVKNDVKTVFFFLDMGANLTGTSVGYVIGGFESVWDWDWESCGPTYKTLQNVSYTGSNSLFMALNYNGSTLSISYDSEIDFISVNINEIFGADNLNLYCGFLSFNTNYVATEVSFNN